MRIPPWFLLTSDLDPALAGGLVDWWLRFDPGLHGVDGPPAAARAIAAAWTDRTGGTTRLRISEGMHVLSEVSDPPRGMAPGALRVASASERELLIDWMVAFGEEVGMPGQGREEAARGVDVRSARGGMLVWDDGRPVTLVGVNRTVAGVARIGPVYTPPSLRSRGYAGSAVAAASRRALAAGAERCMLFTDLSNPTSNKIYAEVGYRRVGAWEQHTFERPR
jgi:predicted GNAT family acetyltransferase